LNKALRRFLAEGRFRVMLAPIMKGPSGACVIEPLRGRPEVSSARSK